MLRKIFAVTVLFLFTAIAAGAQDEAPPEGWQKTANLGLNLTQNGYSDSWEGGEDGSISWNFTADLTAEKQLSPKVDWLNTLKLLYGETHQQVQREDESGNLERSWLAPEKSSDRIFFESLFKFTMGGPVDPYAALTAETQFYSKFDAPFHSDSIPAGADATKRSFLSPLLITESGGVGRTFIKEEHRELYSRLGFAFRQNRGHSPLANASGSDWELDSSSLTDGGAEWVTDYKHTFGEERASWVSKLRVFKALFNSESDALDEADVDWKQPDIAFENTLSAKISEYVQMTFFAEILYDEEIAKRGRFRETLGLGLTYKLF